jgi:ribosomal protein S18 acetylase RimI-like enzyme
MMKNFFEKYGKILILFLVGLTAFYGLRHLKKTDQVNGLVEFNDKRDRAFIKSIFNTEDDYYWLVNYPYFDVDFMLDHKVPSKDKMQYEGKLNVRTFLVDGQPAGFLTYYPKSFKTAWIQFLAVAKEYRGKGYSKDILTSVFQELKNKGFTTLQLLTRINNKPAISLYKSIGFEVTEEDPYGIIYFSRNL